MAVIPMKDGQAQIDLVSLGFQVIDLRMGPAGIMSVMVRDVADLVKLPHYVYWTKLYDRIGKEILAVDLCMVTDRMVQ